MRVVWHAIGLAAALVIASPTVALDFEGLTRVVKEEERRLGARIGVAVIDAQDGARWSHRGDERFPLNSTHKAFLCAAFLNNVDQSQLSLTQTVSVHAASLVTYSPVIEKRVAPQTVSFQEVCEAAVSYSGNTASNIISDAIGGASALTTSCEASATNRLASTARSLNSTKPLQGTFAMRPRQTQ